MKLDEKIEYYCENLDNPEIEKEAIEFAAKLKLKGNILFIVGIILTASSFIAFIALTIIFLIQKQFSLFQIIPFATMVIFSILIYIGLYFKRLSILINE